MRAALSVQSSQAANIAILERACNTFDMIRDALLLRVAGGLPPGPLHELPVPVIAALATAQGHQNTALALCVQSAQDDCAAGGLRGTTLADLLYDEAMYDATAAELIANPTFPVEMYIVEHLACVIPHAAKCRAREAGEGLELGARPLGCGQRAS